MISNRFRLGLRVCALALMFIKPADLFAETLSAEELNHRAVERRAVEAVNWGMPVANFDRMYQAAVKAGGGLNQIVYWPGLSTWKNQTLTPNSDVIYLMPFIDTKDAGPMVLEIPPAGDDGSITGTVMDVWQAALEDVGPAGVDKGNGAKYLILPPGYDQPVPDGYIPLRSMTYEGYALLRSVLKGGSDADLAKAIAYSKQIKLYPLSKAADPPPTKFVDVLNVVFELDDPIRPELLRFAEPHRAIRALAAARQSDDRYAEVNRYREGQAVQP